MCCNASGSELSNWSQLDHEQDKICSALAEAKSAKDKAHSHICHLKKQKELLDCCEGEMIQHSLELLEELKHVEAEETAALVIAQGPSGSSTDIFDFSEPRLASAE